MTYPSYYSITKDQQMALFDKLVEMGLEPLELPHYKPKSNKSLFLWPDDVTKNKADRIVSDLLHP